MSYEPLDRQLRRFSEPLVASVGLRADEIAKLATSIAGEVRFLSNEAKELIRSATPVRIEERLEELIAFQAWMDDMAASNQSPHHVRAHVALQNYVCFVYLGEACFKVLRKVSASGSIVKRCASFLTDNPVRAFRNAVAHANWQYRDDFAGLVYWARKGADPAGSLCVSKFAKPILIFGRLCRDASHMPRT